MVNPTHPAQSPRPRAATSADPFSPRFAPGCSIKDPRPASYREALIPGLSSMPYRSQTPITKVACAQQWRNARKQSSALTPPR